MPAIPLILCGKYEEVGKAFKEAVQPKYEVIYFVTSAETGIVDIPQVLKGDFLTLGFSSGNKVGTGNATLGVPRAVVVVGGTYEDAWVESLRKEIGSGGKGVPILKPDVSTHGEAHGEKPTADSGKVAGERALKVLKKLEEEGKLDSKDDGLYLY
ncbi:hypothetical protein GGR54DRAFT_640104 [Hypoxylon sp. NC1633]|nr:hypothetical protein GGR54DRAFT_640104 [Hypoxylon sp. NC1633]